MEKLAFFGGSFNPPNNMHLEIIKTAINELNLDKAYFVPVGNYYNKINLIDEKLRYEMLELLCRKENNIEVLNIILNSQKKLTAIDTWKLISKKFKNSENYFIMGADNFYNITKWKKYKKLVKNFKIIIINREGYNINDIINNDKVLKNNKENFNIIHIKSQNSDYSSTKVRKMILEGENISNYINSDVNNYITNNKLYQ